MDKSIPLNMIEEEEFNSMISTIPNDPKIADLCKKYYLQFKKQQTSIQADKILLYMKSAYYLAEKSVWIETVDGKRIRNVGLSLNEMVKKHTLEDVMITLKQFSKRITIEDPQTMDDLQKLIKQISFLITFYNKFEKVIAKLQLKQQNNPYSQTLAQFTWLLYIEAKNKILERSLELIDNTCMLAHALCFVLVYSWEWYQAGVFVKEGLAKCGSRKEINGRIYEKVLELFLIKNVESYKSVAERFQAYFAFLKKNNVIRMTPSKDNFLSPQFLQSNYKRLDYFYQKKLDFNYLDQRIFFKDRTSNMTPGKFTPFARQKIHIPTKKLGNNLSSNQSDRTVANYVSHRILNYENMENLVTQQETSSEYPSQQIKFPKNIMQTPLATTTPLIQQTPYTNSIMMYNYVNDLSSRLQKKKFSSRQVDQVIFRLIDEVLGEAIKDENKKSREIKRNHVFSVYKLVAEDFGQLYEKEVEREQIMKALLLVAMEVVFFVSNIDVGWEQLQEKIQVQEIQLWRGVDFFLKFDKSMPANIKIHLLDIEVQLISQKLWLSQQTITLIQSYLSNQKLPTKQTQLLYSHLCRRILHQIAFQIITLIKHLFQSKDQEQLISQLSFQIMKQVLVNHPYMLYRNHFDQIIMCAVFSVCRGLRVMEVKFQDIRQAYLQCNDSLSDKRKVEMFTRVEWDCGEDGGQDETNGNRGIIQFYNQCFLVVMNQFVKNKCQPYLTGTGTIRPLTNRPLQSKDVNSLLQSPISGIIPKDINYNTKKLTTQGNNSKLMPQKSTTPRLHAYTESPLLKNDLISVKNPIQSRKAINFEETEKMLTAQNTSTTTKKQQMGQINLPTNETAKMYQENAQTSNFFNKKFSQQPQQLKPTKLTPQNAPLIKSPHNTTKSPSTTRQSPSPRNDTTTTKQIGGFHNIYYTKRQYGNGKSTLNINR